MRAVEILVEHHRRRLAAELQDALWKGAASPPGLGREQLLFVVHRMIDALIRDVASPDERALSYLLREHLRGPRRLDPVGLFAALTHLSQRIRGLMAQDCDDPAIALALADRLDTAIIEALRAVGPERPAPQSEAPPTAPAPPGPPEPVREPTILRNIHELLGDDGEELVESSVLSIALQDAELSRVGTERLNDIRTTLGERLVPMGMQIVVDEPTLVCACMRARVDDSDVEDALGLAVGLAREELFASCSMGIARGSILTQHDVDRPRAVGAAIQQSMALALRGTKRKVLVDPRVHALADASYVFRSFGDRVFELDGDQPQWIDRWEEAALVVDPGLVGREEALEKMCALLRDACDAPHVIGLRGKLGHGRRSVALEALRRHGVASNKIFETRTHFIAPEPYWPLVGLLRGFLGLADEPLERSALRAALEALGPGLDAVEPTLCALLSVETEDDELGFDELEPTAFRATIGSAIAAVVAAFAARDPGGPVALVVHDAQRLDAPSVQALGHVREHYTGPVPLHLVLTYKGTWRAGGALGRSLQEVSVPGLSREASSEIACQMLEVETLDPELERLVRAHGKGSPMFIATLIRYLVETGALKRSDGIWRLSDLFDDTPTPRRLENLLEARIDHLPLELAGLVQACATIGGPVPQRSLELIWVTRGWALESLPQSIGLLAEMGFVTRTSGGGVSLAHPLVRQVAHRMQSDEERAENHGLALVAYRERYPDAIRQIPALMLAHALEASELEIAREAAIESARRAAQLRDFRAGLTAVERGLDVLSRLGRDATGERFDLLATRELILDARGQRTEQKRDLEEMVELAETLGDRRRVALSLHRAARLNLLLGQPTKADTLAQRALADARSGDPVDLSNVLRTVALIRWQLGDPNGAASALREALAIYESLGHARGMGYVLHNLGLFALDTGATARARSYLQRALSMKQRTDDALGRAAVLEALGQVALNEGRADAAAGALETALAVRLERGDDDGATATRVMLSEGLLESNPTRAEALASAALNAIRNRRGKARIRAEASLVLTRARLALDQRDSANRLAGKALKAAEDVGAPLLRIRAQLTQAEVDLRYRSKRRLERAESLARAAAESAQAIGAVRWRIEALSLLAVALDRRGSDDSGDAARSALSLLEERTAIGIDQDAIRERCRPLLERATDRGRASE